MKGHETGGDITEDQGSQPRRTTYFGQLYSGLHRTAILRATNGKMKKAKVSGLTLISELKDAGYSNISSGTLSEIERGTNLTGDTDALIQASIDPLALGEQEVRLLAAAATFDAATVRQEIIGDQTFGSMRITQEMLKEAIADLRDHNGIRDYLPENDGVHVREKYLGKAAISGARVVQLETLVPEPGEK